jgi:hypothetical protein
MNNAQDGIDLLKGGTRRSNCPSFVDDNTDPQRAHGWQLDPNDTLVTKRVE